MNASASAVKAEVASNRLVVLLHAYTRSPENLAYVADAVSEAMPGAEIYVPRLPFNRWSFEDMNDVARDLLHGVDGQVRYMREKWSLDEIEIILVGHSLGGLLARKVYILACGETSAARFEHSGGKDLQPPLDWAPRVSRIVLLAGMNRGWSVDHHMGIRRSVGYQIGGMMADLLHFVFGIPALAIQVRRGAPFLTELRLQWLAMEFNSAGASALVVQLLGSVDDIVSPQDNIDLVTGNNFAYLDVPESGHENVVQMDETAVGQARKKVFLEALTESPATLKDNNLNFLSDEGPKRANRKVKNVVFVIHGIRDAGYWTQKIARSVQKLGKVNTKIYGTETSTYGYFAMLPFLLFSGRAKKVEWLMDQYVEARALYPDAEFSFVGHSNGTYLLARALQDYKNCRFENVVFAGSVVPYNYDWRAAIDRGQVQALLNFTATADWVVAFFPGALEMLGLQDLGTGSHNGFRQATEACKAGGESLPLYQVRVEGRHGAALAEEHWGKIANFIVNGIPPKSKDGEGQQIVNPRRAWLVVLGGWVAPLIWGAILAVLVWVGRWIWSWDVREGYKTLAEIVYIWIIWKVLTKV